MKLIITGWFLCLFFLNSFSQNSVQVRYDYDASGNAIFNADNYTAIPVYLVLNFSYLNYASFSESLPYIKRINPGTTQLFTIFRELDQPSPNFNIEYKLYNSHPSPETDIHFPYLIPAKAGTNVTVTDYRTKGKERSVGFILTQSNEVFAARKGIVVNVIENFDPKISMENMDQQNFVHILHDDGTIGEYFNFSYKGVDCEIEQKVIPGQKLGKAASIPGSSPIIGFSLFHSDQYSNGLIYLIPEFCLDKSKSSLLSVTSEYKVIHPDEIITRELSRKEIKAFKSK